MRQFHRFGYRTLAACALLVAAGIFTAGCADQGATTQPGVYDPADAALKDPMNYSPNISKTDTSSGGIGDIDNHGIKQDANDVLNP